jgi:hypothetical protein
MDKLTIRAQLVLLVLCATVPALGVAVYRGRLADSGVSHPELAASRRRTLLAAAIAWYGVRDADPPRIRCCSMPRTASAAAISA